MSADDGAALCALRDFHDWDLDVDEYTDHIMGFCRPNQ